MLQKNMDIIVTGAAGMIGNYVIRDLLKFGYKVVAIDNLWRGKLKYLKTLRFQSKKRFYTC